MGMGYREPGRSHHAASVFPSAKCNASVTGDEVERLVRSCGGWIGGTSGLVSGKEKPANLCVCTCMLLQADTDFPLAVTSH